ncbi:hypothetical protein FB45DRAFT_869644 [Roridomyces roridus]|uniref:Uncharacterized protein n=1 Tax=Roridomyces roridus TaxID=1738132 RepID=A0AAD7FKU2_9AGAR|nr:hypothetical protein FB45DRAFT_869644 [Roridomyces roridus]
MSEVLGLDLVHACDRDSALSGRRLLPRLCLRWWLPLTRRCRLDDHGIRGLQRCLREIAARRSQLPLELQTDRFWVLGVGYMTVSVRLTPTNQNIPSSSRDSIFSWTVQFVHWLTISLAYLGHSPRSSAAPSRNRQHSKNLTVEIQTNLYPTNPITKLRGE